MKREKPTLLAQVMSGGGHHGASKNAVAPELRPKGDFHHVASFRFGRRQVSMPKTTLWGEIVER